MSKRWYVIHAYSGFEGQVKRSLDERVRRAGLEDLARVVAGGRLKPVIDRVFPFGEARAAFEHLKAARHIGKIVISVG